MGKSVKIKDKEFELFLSEKVIIEAIERIAGDMNRDLEGKNPLFVCVLNGSFMFASELMKKINIPCEITFVRVSSYEGTHSTGQLKEIYGLEDDVKDRTMVIVEDIIDTGRTMELMLKQFKEKSPKEIKVATLLFKPNALICEVPRHYVAMEIPNDFIVGFGLDYDGYGRNYADIYKIKE